MKLIPVLTEKSLAEAKKGKYTFLTDVSLRKHEIKSLVGNTYKVHVVSVQTIVKKAEEKRTAKGKSRFTKVVKKAIVSLKSGEKIKDFDTKEEKKK